MMLGALRRVGSRAVEGVGYSVRGIRGEGKVLSGVHEDSKSLQGIDRVQSHRERCWLVRRAVGLAVWLAGAILATIRRISGRVDGLIQFVLELAAWWIFTLVFEVWVCVFLHVLAVLVNWVQHDPLFSVPNVSLGPSGEAPPLKKRPTRSSKETAPSAGGSTLQAPWSSTPSGPEAFLIRALPSAQVSVWSH